MDISDKQVKKFGKFRSFLWPIHNYELKKIIPMLIMFFFISFNYSVLRNIKDSLLVTSVGAEVLPYIKFWGVTPMAIIFMILYSKLSNVLSKQSLFYAALAPFIVFFVIFALVLYPLKDAIHPTQLKIAFLPDHFTSTIRVWSFSLFYIFAELWGSVALSLLFWQFANDITKVEESKRFYALFGLGANLALEFAAQAITFFTNKERTAAFADPMQYSVNGLVAVFTLFAIGIISTYAWMNRYVLTDSKFYDPNKLKKKKDKPKMSLGQSFKMLLKSKYLLCIAMLVISYGISINLIEVTWKNQIRLQYPNMTDYLNFMGQYSRCVAWSTIFMMLFVSGNVMRRFGWTVAAQITPVVLLVTGICFFGLIIFKNQAEAILAPMNITVLVMTVIFGTIQNVASKASKYSLFDPTKEMAYIPLDEDSKVKGKAAIDVVAARFGKAGGSIIQQALFVVGPLSVVAPYIALIFLCVMGIWIVSAKKLGKEFNILSSKK